MKKKLPLLLLIALVFGAFIRLIQLSSLPISLFGDEVDVGYHALSLITTGRDYMGHLLPTYIQSLNEFRAPLLMYFVAPFVALLGPSTLAVRLAPALFGVLGIFLIYLLGNQLSSKKIKIGKFCFGVGELAAFVLAITPWHIHYSRAAFEVTLLLDLLMAGTYFFFRGIKKPALLTWSAVCFSLTFYTYSTANLFTPLLLLVLFLLYKKELPFKKIKQALLVGLVVCLPIAYHLLFGNAAGRFGLISIFNDSRVADTVVLSRIEPWVSSPFLERLFNNKITAPFQVFVSQYLNAFSPQFLFISGDPIFRHSINNFGMLLLSFLPFLLLGVYSLFKNRQSKTHRFLLFWLLIAPLGSSLTQEGGTHATRLILLLPALTITTALGLVTFFSLLKSKFIKTVFAIIVFLMMTFNLASYWYEYSAHYRYQSARHWHYGYQQIMVDLKPHLANTNHVYINNVYEPSLLRFAFFSGLKPVEFQAMFTTDVPDQKINTEFNGFPFGEKYYFGEINDYRNLTLLLEEGDIYLAVQGREVPGDWDWSQNPLEGIRVLSMVKDIMGQPLFYLLTLE